MIGQGTPNWVCLGCGQPSSDLPRSCPRCQGSAFGQPEQPASRDFTQGICRATSAAVLYQQGNDPVVPENWRPILGCAIPPYSVFVHGRPNQDYLSAPEVLAFRAAFDLHDRALILSAEHKTGPVIRAFLRRHELASKNVMFVTGGGLRDAAILARENSVDVIVVDSLRKVAVTPHDLYTITQRLGLCLWLVSAEPLIPSRPNNRMEQVAAAADVVLQAGMRPSAAGRCDEISVTVERSLFSDAPKRAVLSIDPSADEVERMIGLIDTEGTYEGPTNG